MTEAEVMKLVQREISSIKKRDGQLDKPGYLWAEISTRLSTLKPWDGVCKGTTVAQALRPLVEAAVLCQVPPLSPDEPQHMPPLQAAVALGTKKHKHLHPQTKRTTDARQFRPAS